MLNFFFSRFKIVTIIIFKRSSCGSKVVFCRDFVIMVVVFLVIFGDFQNKSGNPAHNPEVQTNYSNSANTKRD